MNARPFSLPLPASLERVLRRTPALRQSYLVGGCVRDALLGLPVKDYDVEVFGVDYETLQRALAPYGRTDLVGRSFGVVKLTLPDGVHDFSIPRRDRKTGPGHRGFTTTFDPGIAPAEAAARRDFTLNALMYDPREGCLLDYYGGQADLEARVLRHTSDAFGEDPLRVLRGMQLAGRFGLTAAPETVALCRAIREDFAELPADRVRGEWWKWAALSTQPSRGLQFLAATDWSSHFPELHALMGVPQDDEWHPEGDVFTHTCHCCDAMARLPAWQGADEESRVVLMLATLAHDFGKAQTTRAEEREGRWRIVSPGHEEAGGPLAERFLGRVGVPVAVRERVVPLVTNHLAHLQMLSPRGVRRLARRLEPETIERLCLVIEADQGGRPPRPGGPTPELEALRALAAQLELEKAAPQPILKGRHLLELGYAPGRAMGALLEEAFEAQIEGQFSDLEGALKWLKGKGPSG